MRIKTRSLSVLAAFSVFAFATLTSCSKNTSNNTAGSTISATIGTTNYNSYVTSTYSVSNDLYDIVGVSISNKDTLALELTFPTLPVNHPIDLDTTFASLNYTIGVSNPVFYQGGFQSGHLVLTLSALDTAKHTVSGIFQGTIYSYLTRDSLVVTNGKFNTSYTLTN